MGTVNEEFARNAARITGCCNEDTWHGFEPGEALLLGADGSDGTEAEAEVTWHIAADENLQDLVIGGISGIEKAGHDFHWVSWEMGRRQHALCQGTAAGVSAEECDGLRGLWLAQAHPEWFDAGPEAEGSPLDCPHRGGELRRQLCPSCGGSVRIKVHA